MKSTNTSIGQVKLRMTNQTLIAVPAGVAETTDTIQLFLTRLVEELDIVLGYRGNSTYISTADVDVGGLTTLQDLFDASETLTASLGELTEIVETNASNIDSNTDSISSLESRAVSTVLGAAYHDFDTDEFADLIGNAEVVTLGSNLSNTPYTPVGGETYYNYFNAVVTDNGGVVQELKAYSTTTLAPTSYFRIGNDWTAAKALGWT